MNYLKKVCIGLGFVLQVTVAWASPPTGDSVEHLVRLLFPEPDTYIHAIIAPQKAAYAESLLKLAYKKPSASEINEVHRIVGEAFDKEINWQTLKPDFISALSRNFSQAEVDGLAAFFAGPTGQAWLRKQPMAWVEVQNAVNEKARRLMSNPNSAIISHVLSRGENGVSSNY